MNANLRFLDGIIMFSTPVAPLATPPGSPTLGDRYIVGASATGAWAGKDGKIVVYQKDETNTSAWAFFTPQEGWGAKVLDVTTTIAPVEYVYRGGNWLARFGTMATETLPAAGLIRSTGTHLASVTLESRLTLDAGGTLHMGLGAMADESMPAVGLVRSTGTHVAGVTLDSHLTIDGAGNLSTLNLATLDVGGANSGRVPFTMLPAALSEALHFAGTWNANTGTTSLSTVLASGTGEAGAMFKVSTAGTTTIDGVSQWNVGDEIAFSGVSNTWVKIDGISTEVISVATQTGAVVFTPGVMYSNGTIVVAATAGNGISLGATITNTGVLAFTQLGTAVAGNVPVGQGLLLSFGGLVNSGVVSLQQGTLALSGTLTIGPTMTLSAGGQLDMPAQPYEPKFGFSAGPAAGQLLFADFVTRTVNYLGNFAGAVFRVNGAPLNDWICPIKKNGSTVGTLTVLAGATSGTYATTSGAAVALANTNYFEVFAPLVADPNIAQGYGTFAGLR